MTFDCDCLDCVGSLLAQIPEPKPGFSQEALRKLWTPDEEVTAFCQHCSERGDCVYAGDRSARVMCRAVKGKLGP
jgi:hypothetical protein